jgi:hypothetical protein
MLFDRFGCVEMIKFLMIKIVLSCRLSTQMYRYSPFVVTSSADGASRSIYGGLYTVEDYGEGYFFPTWVARIPPHLHPRRSTIAQH